MTSHNDNYDHQDDIGQQTNGRANYGHGHSLNMHSEDGEIRNCPWSLAGTIYTATWQDFQNAKAIRQVVQSEQPVEPMQAFHFERGKDLGV